MSDDTKACQEVLQTISKVQKESELKVIEDFRFKLTEHINLIEVFDLFKLPVEHYYGLYSEWMQLSGAHDHFTLTYFDADTPFRKVVNCSDDGSQPKNEWLLQVCFPTGAFIFGDSYPKELFHKFFLELKGYGAKYCDTTNKSLYFSPESAKDIYEAYPEIFTIYRDEAKVVGMKAQKEKLEAQLKALEAAS